MLKKERLENNKLYEAQFQKLQIMLEEKVRELDALSLRYNDLMNDKEVSQIKFEEEINKLKNLMSRNTHELERDFEFNKDKIMTEHGIELENMRKNHSSQILILEDEIAKQKGANKHRSDEFEVQLLENKKLKDRYQLELRNMAVENENLRTRLIKLEDMNKSEVENIKEKYSDIHHQGQTTLKQQYDREMRLLI